LDSLPVILVVEDDSLLQQLAEEILTEGGFKVELASSAEQALALIDGQIALYRTLVTDVNLGSETVTGWEVARHTRELAPDIPVVYMTGDSAAEWTSRGVPNSILLTKPFAPAQLLTAVSQLLNAAAPPTT
jgi:CheY-like chemotaxis protein